MHSQQVCVVAAIICCWAAAVSCQGLLAPTEQDSVGARLAYSSLTGAFQRSKKWKAGYRIARRAQCSPTGGTLCSAGDAQGSKYQDLLVALSPSVLDTRDPRQTGGFSCIGPARDQHPCSTCTSMAAVAAAEAAVACISRKDASSIRLSEQDHYFCSSRSMQRLCDSGATLKDALTLLTSYQLVKSSCLPYDPDPTMERGREQLCRYKCKTPDATVALGKFTVLPITSLWVAQRHIRRYGSVVTRMNIYSDFRAFFKRSPTGVYRPGKGAVMLEPHAVICHGYNNFAGYWVCLNSWGDRFGDRGSFKIAFGAAGIMSPGEMYGVKWEPNKADRFASMVTPSGTKGCYEYKARPGDHLSGIAEQMWGPGLPGLQRLLLDNAAVLTDLDAPVTGKVLRVCNPLPTSILLQWGPSDWKDNDTCTASELQSHGWDFHKEKPGGSSAGGGYSDMGYTATSGHDCCRLCAATPGCFLWSWMYYAGDYDCDILRVSDLPVEWYTYNKKYGGFITKGPSAVAVMKPGCPSHWVLPGIELVGGDIWGPGKDWWLAEEYGKGPTPPSTTATWQECCKLASHRSGSAWTWGPNRRCSLKATKPFNGQLNMEIHKARVPGVVSGVRRR